MMGIERLRHAKVAGYFYPQEPERLRQELRRLTRANAPRVPAIGAIIPHGGYQFSGPIVGETLSAVSIPTRCVMLAPNHAAWGVPWSLMTEGAYQTPLGEVPIDERLAHALLNACPLLIADHLAHRDEHAIEVELPFVQWLGPASLTIVPLVIHSDDAQECDHVATALAQVIRQTEEHVLLIASADFTHYEPHDVVAHKDAQLIDALHTLDARQFLHRVNALSVSMCGQGPIACLLGAAQHLGATTAQLIRYGTSAEAGGDPQSAIGYAGMLLN